MLRSLCILTIMVLTAHMAIAQADKGRYPVWQRISLGYGKHFVDTRADFSYTDRTNNIFSATRSIKTSASTTLYGDVYFPLGRIEDNIAVAVNIGLNYNMTTLTHDTVVLDTSGFQKDIKMKIYGLPISIDFKTGGEVSQSKAYRTMFTAGLGVQPIYGQSDAYVSEGSKSIDKPFKLISFVKLEAGFFAGVAFKLRAMAYFGQVTYVDRNEVLIGEYGGKKDVIIGYRRTTATGPFGYTLSLIVMPTSFTWRKE